MIYRMLHNFFIESLFWIAVSFRALGVFDGMCGSISPMEGTIKIFSTTAPILVFKILLIQEWSEIEVTALCALTSNSIRWAFLRRVHMTPLRF